MWILKRNVVVGIENELIDMDERLIEVKWVRALVISIKNPFECCLNDVIHVIESVLDDFNGYSKFQNNENKVQLCSSLDSIDAFQYHIRTHC